MSTIQIRKKPVVVTAVQWTGNNDDDLITFTDDQFRAFNTGHPNLDNLARNECDVHDPEASAAVYDYLHVTWVGVKTRQYVIKGVKGEFYPIDEQVLAETYDRVNPLAEAANGAAEAVTELAEAADRVARTASSRR